MRLRHILNYLLPLLTKFYTKGTNYTHRQQMSGYNHIYNLNINSNRQHLFLTFKTLAQTLCARYHKESKIRIKQYLPSSAYNPINIYNLRNVCARTGSPVLSPIFRGLIWLTSSDLKACLVCVYFKNLGEKENYLSGTGTDLDLITLIF